MNAVLRRAINVKNMLKRKYDKCKCTENWQKFRSQRNLVNKIRKQSIANYMKTTCSESKGKPFWNAVKPLFSDKSCGQNDDIILKNDTTIVSNKSDVCDILNKYFVSVAKDTINQPYKGLTQDTDIEDLIESFSSHRSIECIKDMKQDDASFHFKNVTLEEILSMLEHINSKKATGYDNVPGKLLKIGAMVQKCYVYPFNP